MGTTAGRLIGTVAVQIGIEVTYLILAARCPAVAGVMTLVRRPDQVGTGEPEICPMPTRGNSDAFLGLGDRRGGSYRRAGEPRRPASAGAREGSLTDRRGATSPLVIGLIRVGLLLLLGGAQISAPINGALIIGFSSANSPWRGDADQRWEAMGWPLRFAIALSATVGPRGRLPEL